MSNLRSTSLRFLVILAILFSFPSFAQNTVTGVVIEESTDGRFHPIPFANVYWKGTQIGTSTDTAGHFELPKNKTTRTLIISYVGYTSDTIKVEHLDKLTIVLKQSKELGGVDVVYRQRGTEIDTGFSQYYDDRNFRLFPC